MKEKKEVLDLASILGEEISARGWVPKRDVFAWGREKEIDINLLNAAVKKLSRDSIITSVKGPPPELLDGFECTMGTAKSRAKRYGEMGPPLRFEMVLVTDSLGQLDVPGKEHQFALQRDYEGNVLFVPAQFRAMLVKARMQSGLEKYIPKAAFHHVYVEFCGVTMNGDGFSDRIRRPINRKTGESVGELHHEGLPPGSRIKWIVRFPESHFTPEQIERLLHTAQGVGFTPAGSGPGGGTFGLFKISSGQEETRAAEQEQEKVEQPT